MTKGEIRRAVRQPFKESFFRDENGIAARNALLQRVHGHVVRREYHLQFEDSVLVAQEQGDEERLYQSGRLED
ncbi:MAG: hypothetical protein ACLR76_07795 [Alistipes sp.]